MKPLILAFALAFYIVSAHAAPGINLDASNILLTLMSFFGIGILMAFTPCVLPMIPILAGILIGQERISSLKSFQLSLAFVLGMAVTYAIAGVAAGYLGNTIQTSLQLPWVIVGFSMLFILMALSMFGLFETQMPRFLVNRVDKMNQHLRVKSLISVALMGGLSTLIASPCVTAPMISILTYISQTGRPMIGGLALFVLALGMGLPLIIFALGQERFIPKTGEWMLKVKNLFGIMMLGLAIWMLGRILPSNITLLLWSALIILSAISWGALTFNANQLSSRFIQGVSFFALLYGVMLMIGALSGHDDMLQPLKDNTHQTRQRSEPVASLFTNVENLRGLNEKLAQAKSLHKPVMIDFYASWCPDCRALDKNAFANLDVQNLMQAFVVIRVDISQSNAELAAIRNRYHILGIPSLVFYDKQGNEVASEPGQELNRDFIKRQLLALA